MATRIDTLLDKNEDTVLPITRTKAVYDDNNNRLDNILSGFTSAYLSETYVSTLAQATSNISEDVSDFLVDTTNYVYIPIVISSNNGTDNGTPISMQIDHTAKVAMLARCSGVSSALTITVTYKILKIKVQ